MRSSTSSGSRNGIADVFTRVHFFFYLSDQLISNFRNAYSMNVDWSQCQICGDDPPRKHSGQGKRRILRTWVKTFSYPLRWDVVLPCDTLGPVSTTLLNKQAYCLSFLLNIAHVILTSKIRYEQMLSRHRKLIAISR